MARELSRESAHDEAVAALRDASFLSSGRLNDNRALGHIPAYHVVRPDDPHYVSGCGRILDPGTEVTAIGVAHRCQRRGCRERWPS